MDNIMKKLLLLIVVAAFASCTTITISEKDVFDVKRTIDAFHIEKTGARVESIRIATQDNLELYGWWITKLDAMGTVLYFGGNGFVRVASQHIIDAFLQHPVNLLVFDYRGYGRNSGEPSVNGLKMDGVAAFNFLVNEKSIPPEQIVLHGHSMGSFMAAYLAAEKTTGGLVLESPITTIEDLTDLLVPWFAKPLVKFDIDSELKENNNLEWVDTYAKPLLIISGDNDKVTPFSMAEKLFDASASSQRRLVIVAGGAHNDLPERREYFLALDEFYQNVFDSGTAKDESFDQTSLLKP
jgi:alpha-beta hydrolase superfamily lysophospholipase